MEIHSLYNTIYGGGSHKFEDEVSEDEGSDNEEHLQEIIPIRSDDILDKSAVIVLHEAHLVSRSLYQSELLRFGSGRLLELEVLGSHRNVHLVGDLEIRYCLSEDRLPSSCFIIEIKQGVAGIPALFVFIGAGKGHGVGMCQAGAIDLAYSGNDYLTILKHYFGHFKVVTRWPMTKFD